MGSAILADARLPGPMTTIYLQPRGPSILTYFGHIWDQQGKSEGFDSCDRPSNVAQIGFKSSIFQPV